MKLRTKPVYLSETDMYKEFLKHSGNILPKEKRLTETEMDILSVFWDFQGNNMELLRFSPQIKKLVREKFNFKKHANLENYLKSLRDKGYITKDQNGFTVISKAFDLKKPLQSIEITYEYKLQEG